MQAVAGKTVDELPLIDWEESSMNCGGDIRDDAFLADLLVCFCTEGIPRLQKLLGAVLAYRSGANTWASPGEPPRAIETVLKEEAHALKGSAANVRLWKLAKACEDTELPCKALLQAGQSSSDRKAVLDKFCVSPCDEVREVVTQFRAFVGFMESTGPEGMRAQVEEGVDLAEALGPSMDALNEQCTLDYLQSQIAELWAKFNAEAAPEAAPAPVADVEPAPVVVEQEPGQASSSDPEPHAVPVVETTAVSAQAPAPAPVVQEPTAKVPSPRKTVDVPEAAQPAATPIKPSPAPASANAPAVAPLVITQAPQPAPVPAPSPAPAVARKVVVQAPQVAPAPAPAPAALPVPVSAPAPAPVPAAAAAPASLPSTQAQNWPAPAPVPAPAVLDAAPS